MAEGLRHATYVGRNYRHAAGQSLDDDHAVRLGPGREHHHVRGGIGAVEIGSGPRSPKANAIGQGAVLGAATDPFHERRVPLKAAHAHTAPGHVRHRRQRVEQDIVALDGGDRRHAEKRLSGRGPGYDVGRIDPGLGDVHPVGR